MTEQKKVKTFRISPTTQYKLTKLKEAWKKSEGKVLEQLINSAYYQIYTSDNVTLNSEWLKENKQRLKEIIETEWVQY